MTASARVRIDCGRTRPISFAVLRLINQLEFVRLLDRDVAGLGSPENSDELSCDLLPIDLGVSRAVSHQTASFGDFGPLVDCGEPEYSRALDDQLLVEIEQSRCQDVERLGPRSLCVIER